MKFIFSKKIKRRRKMRKENILGVMKKINDYIYITFRGNNKK